MALRPVDRLIAGYLGFVTVVILVRQPFDDPATIYLLLMHALVGVLLFLFTRLGERERLGGVLHDFYPLLLLLPLYAEIGVLGVGHGIAATLQHDAVLQRIEQGLFGNQWSFAWIRQQPSVFWSGTFHLAYFAYYPIVLLGPAILAVQGRRDAARGVVFGTLVAFVVCYVTFVLYPVAGPYYAFEHPTGPVREVWSAKLIYGVLASGSSFGAAFPSSHVAATVAATLVSARYSRTMGLWFAVPCILLTVGTVYCQMHYVIDASSGVLVGAIAWAVTRPRLPTLNPGLGTTQS